MRKVHLLLSIILISSLGGVRAQSTDEFLNQLNANINEYFLSRPHDNVYVHTDRSVYFPGEEVLLRVIVTDAATLRMSDRSNRCQIMLLSDKGEEMISASYDLTGGSAYGNFLLPDGLDQGVYSLVAYVTQDKLITTNKVFHKEIVITDPSEQLMLDFDFDREEYMESDEIGLTVNAYGNKSRGLSGVKVNAILKSGEEVLEELDGKTSRDGSLTLAFKMPDDEESHPYIEIYAEKRKASQEMSIRVPSEHKIPQEVSRRNNSDIMLNGKISGGNRLHIGTVYSDAGIDEDTPIIIALFRKGLIYWSAPGKLHQTKDLSIPLARVPSGILDIVMFSSEGKVLAEDLVYYAREDDAGLKLMLDRDQYGKRQPVRLTLGIEGARYSVADDSYFSVSVVPADMLPPEEVLLDEKMLIDADLKQDTRRWLNDPSTGDLQQKIDRLLKIADRNGYRWEMVTGGGDAGMMQNVDEQFEEEIDMDQHFPAWFEASHMQDYEEGIMDARFPDADELFYVKQLENGTPVLDVIKSIKPFTMQGNKIIFPGTNNSINFQQGALIVIDNVQVGEDASVLSTISPNQVESINISTNPTDIHKYTGLNVVGVIEINMKGYEPGSRLVEESERDALVRDSYGEYLPGYPDYSLDSDLQDVRVDHRRTIFWEPELRFTDDAEITLEFYTSDMPGTYVITVQGMVGTVPVALRKTFKVE